MTELSPNQLRELASLIAAELASRMGQGDELLDVHQAARLLNVSVPTLERRTADNSIPSVKLGRCRRYRKSDLLNIG